MSQHLRPFHAGGIVEQARVEVGPVQPVFNFSARMSFAMPFRAVLNTISPAARRPMADVTVPGITLSLPNALRDSGSLSRHSRT
jgi:hypothetical protein